MIHVGSSVRGAAHVLGSHITVVMDLTGLERNIYLGRPISVTISVFIHEIAESVLV